MPKTSKKIVAKSKPAKNLKAKPKSAKAKVEQKEKSNTKKQHCSKSASVFNYKQVKNDINILTDIAITIKNICKKATKKINKNLQNEAISYDREIKKLKFQLAMAKTLDSEKYKQSLEDFKNADLDPDEILLN